MCEKIVVLGAGKNKSKEQMHIGIPQKIKRHEKRQHFHDLSEKPKSKKSQRLCKEFKEKASLKEMILFGRKRFL